MKRFNFLIFAVSFFVFSVFFSGAQEANDNLSRRFLAKYAMTFFNTGINNFPSDEANAVIQTKDGYIWFGGYSGLIRYDGVQYRIWDAMSPNGFNSSNVRALHEDRDGMLWIGTNDKGLAVYKNGSFTVYDNTMGIPSNTIRSITQAQDGRIYCGTPDGLFFIDAERNITTVTLDTAVHPFVVSVSCDAQNNIFIVFNSGELFARSDSGTVQYPYGGGIRFVECVSGNRIVAGTQDGSVIITEFDGSGTFSSPRIRQTPLLNVSSIYEDSNGYIWIISERGIGFLDTEENFYHAGNPNGIGFYSDICEDYQNGYWITGTQGGIVKLTLSAFSRLNSLDQFETGAVNAVLIDKRKTFIGGDNGLFILDEDGKPALTGFSSQVTARVRGIFRDSRGQIWICTFSGVIRFNPETNDYKTWLVQDGLVSDRARCWTELPNGVIVIGTATGVSFIRGDTVISASEAFGTEGGESALRDTSLPRITVLSLVCTPDGTLYIGTDGSGIYAVNRNGTAHFNESNGLTGGVILRMLVNRKTGGVWVSSSHGLCYIDENNNVHVIKKIPPYTFLDIMQHDNELFLLTASIVIRTDAGALLNADLPFDYVSAGKSSGLTSSINSNSWNLITDDGNLYICCESGVNIYGFKSGGASFIPFAGIAGINIDGIEYADFSDKIIMPNNTDRLTISLSYLSFGFLDDAALYYILIGQDSEAHSLSKTNTPGFQVSYTNLRGGNYNLQVWTEDKSGNRGNFLEVEFFKELKWFEYVIVWVAAALTAVFLTALLLVVIVRIKSRVYKEKQREYRAIISQALSAIANAIDAKDSYTSGHSVRTAAYSVEIARRMGMDKDFIENLYYIGLLHDVGKIGIPNEIINKPAKLTEEEFNAMKHHPHIGLEILKDITTINNLTAGAAEHHERWDGKGYYRGINGEGISLEGRIIAAADTYDAMSSNRSYRKGLPKEVIVEEFRNGKGKQFDPKIADIVIDMIENHNFDAINVNKIIDIQDQDEDT
ncbi:MAG: HD domain-containing protein [Treponema sp.]|jgi:ligand-binding sensor domain-containing protein|nr:HD domain-containing protein [Treponema sp.]